MTSEEGASGVQGVQPLHIEKLQTQQTRQTKRGPCLSPLAAKIQRELNEIGPEDDQGEGSSHPAKAIPTSLKFSKWTPSPSKTTRFPFRGIVDFARLRYLGRMARWRVRVDVHRLRGRLRR